MAQKFFVVSDVHGFYDELISALNDAGFDKNNKDHWLVSCGDEWDRGSKPLEVMKFFINLERKILVRGNHIDLFEELCQRGYPEWHDKSNGTVDTVLKIGEYKIDHEFDLCCERALSKTARYRELLVNYFETQNYIFVHSFIPTIKIGYDNYEYKENWRKATDQEWETAMWVNPYDMAKQDLNKTGKTIVFGHFHTSYQWAKDGKCSEFGEDAIFESYYGKNYIGIDSAVAYTNKINVIVLEDEIIDGSY